MFFSAKDYFSTEKVGFWQRSISTRKVGTSSEKIFERINFQQNVSLHKYLGIFYQFLDGFTSILFSTKTIELELVLRA